ncbi:PAS domain-containing hybrid sensor histidine kinase/response regulator [Sorangium cellulosum]|uniref:histidine kinase n=1 Tax=Sorangium cellulosum TaxID=56 RepID=A0A150QB84_SORCE|nr:PAS domain-containing hybrid sensor histidine kinase/response regulator [Sorangium cellulosum]KYF65247.1 hybrid sensor histidine kinase/response regulator [Sorangium cellulosum]
MSSGRTSRDPVEHSPLLAAGAPAGLYVASLDGRLVDCNEALARLLGYGSREEALAAADLVLGGCVAGAKPTSAGAIESCLMRRDGSAVRVMRTEALTEAGGERLVVGAIVDLSTSRSSEDRRRELSEELRQAQKMEAVGRLAGGIAHDYNNLLAIILNYTSLVMEELDEQSPVQKDLVEIKRAAQRAASLTRQLLTVSRRGLVQPVVLDLRDVVRAMDGALRAAVGGAVELAIALGPSGCRVLADAGQIEQVVMNLALNARDAMEEGGKLSIEARAVRVGVAGSLHDAHPALPPGRYARLVVRDTGSGMSDDVRTRAFEPFFTTKPRGKGTGLGLATVYGIVKQWRGHIELASQPGQGTRVEIYLPLAAARPAASRRGREARAAPGRGEGGTVLVTDDEVAVVTLASRILAQGGYTTLTARGPREAMRVCEAQRGRIDLLLTDVLMPEMSGCELADRLAKLRPDMRVLFMSGYTGDALDGPRAARPDAPLLAKPFTAESLLRAVRKALEGAA